VKRKTLPSSLNLKSELHHTLNPTIKLNEKKVSRYNQKNNNDKQLKQKDNSRDTHAFCRPLPIVIQSYGSHFFHRAKTSRSVQIVIPL
jgi:hypothetical protein